MYKCSQLVLTESDFMPVSQMETKLNIPIPLKSIFYENQSYYIYLESAFNFYKSNNSFEGSLTSEQLIKLKNLTVDLPTGAFFTTYLSPRYDLCITALCTCIDQKYIQENLQVEDTYPLFRTLQLMHISFFCFVFTSYTRPSISSNKTVSRVLKMMTRVLNKDACKRITLSKGNDSGTMVPWIENSELYRDISVMKLYFSLHLQLLPSIINIKLQMCDQLTFILSEWEEIYGIIHAFLLQTESLCYALARSVMLSREIVHSNINMPAYMIIFEKRNSIIKPPSFIEENELKCEKGEIPLIVKQLLMSMFDALSKIHWSDIRQITAEENTLLKGSLLKERIKGIQSALLVIGDLDLCSKCRIVNLTELTKDLIPW
ncbi:hypothetical protein C6P45_000171 [Maudiozyma exigua]|uniref:Uncharacterized protein n=1 Tax=Maudiozyma exigua TaxID=34358 RepID=A0A9P6W875_MAUEX|nr:hypothetical protein C6P45_000171 [Kazachstania exigua]